MTNPLDVCRVHQWINRPANPATTPIWQSFVSFTDTSTSTQASVWASSLPDGARTASGSQQNVVTGPVVNFSAVPGASDALAAARALAMTQLLDQLIPSLAGTGATWPASFGQG